MEWPADGRERRPLPAAGLGYIYAPGYSSGEKVTLGWDEVRVLCPGTAHVAYLGSAAVGCKLQAPPRGGLDEPQALIVASRGFDAHELAGDPRFADPL